MEEATREDELTWERKVGVRLSRLILVKSPDEVRRRRNRKRMRMTSTKIFNGKDV
jgi:hypothetical protein